MTELEPAALYHVQYRDKNASKKDYANLAPDELLVTSMFHTIQGEGTYAGRPAVFVRLSGCNRGDKVSMGCSFCDTDFRLAHGKILSIRTIMETAYEMWVRTCKVAGKPFVVITGGEPMLQDNLTALCLAMIHSSFEIQIESNGDRLAAGFGVPALEAVHLCVSPKTRGPYHWPAPEVLHRADSFKILVDTRPDSQYSELPEWLPGVGQGVEPFVRRRAVFLSPLTVYRNTVPEGTTSSIWDSELIDQPATRANYAYAAQLAMRYGYRVSLQTHLMLEMP